MSKFSTQNFVYYLLHLNYWYLFNLSYIIQHQVEKIFCFKNCSYLSNKWFYWSQIQMSNSKPSVDIIIDFLTLDIFSSQNRSEQFLKTT